MTKTVPGFLSYVDAAGRPIGPRRTVAITHRDSTITVDPPTLWSDDAFTAAGWGVFNTDGVPLIRGWFDRPRARGDSAAVPTFTISPR